MKMIVFPVFLACGMLPASAQERTPVSGITEATWNDYRDAYGNSPLCAKEEITLWTCEKNRRVFSLCSSRAVTRASGHMQYRASKDGKIVFVYPASKKPPLGFFTYASYPNGDASIGFLSNGYRYSIVDPLRDRSSILVAEPAPSEKTTEITCGPNQTLQVNYTMRLMRDSGVWVNP